MSSDGSTRESRTYGKAAVVKDRRTWLIEMCDVLTTDQPELIDVAPAKPFMLNRYGDLLKSLELRILQ